MNFYITFRDTRLIFNITTVSAMKASELYMDIMGTTAQASAIENGAAESMTAYKSASDILNRTYAALGRKRVANFSRVGSTKETINVKHLPDSSTTV